APPTSTLFPYTTLFRSTADALPKSQESAAVGPHDEGGIGGGLGDRGRVASRRIHLAHGRDVRPIQQASIDRRIDPAARWRLRARSEEHTSELQSRGHLV